MNKERLLTLAKFLEDLPKHKFMFGTWMTATNCAVSSYDIDEKKRFAKALETRDEKKPAFKYVKERGATGSVIVEPNLCQTVGCALGWAATIPEFKKEGLHLISHWDKETGTDDAFVALFENPKDIKHSSYSRDVMAGAQFFDIDYMDAQMLFLNGPARTTNPDYTSAKDVAKAIRQMVKGHVEPVQA